MASFSNKQRSHWHGPKCGCLPDTLSEQARFHEEMAAMASKRLAAAKLAVKKQQDVLKFHESEVFRLRAALEAEAEAE